MTLGGAAGGAGFGDAEGRRGIGEARCIRQRLALGQRDGQPGVESVARAGRVYNIHLEARHDLAVRVRHDLRASRPQRNHRHLLIAR